MSSGLLTFNKSIFSNPKELSETLKSIDNTGLVLTLVKDAVYSYSEKLIAYPYSKKGNKIEPVVLSDILIDTSYYSENIARSIEVCSPFLAQELEIDNFVKSKGTVTSLYCLLLNKVSSSNNYSVSNSILIDGTIKSMEENSNGYCFVAKVDNGKLRLYKMYLDPFIH